MAIIDRSQAQPEYDVAIVGSGAGGGQMAYTLTLAGLKCVMLEAGRSYDPPTQTAMLHRPDQTPLLNTPTPDKQMGFTDATVDGGWIIPDEPYTQASEKPEEQFSWWRPRMLGGRTNHWGRMSLRNGPYDFKPRSRDGLGFDWADQLRRRGALLHESGNAHRRLRHERRDGEHAQFPGRRAAPTAQGARLGTVPCRSRSSRSVSR
ncbi:MAG: hypothetical protein WDN28_04195 [Chthoniobacter sp.]